MFDALGDITISRGCFERSCSNKQTPSYRSSNLSFVTLQTPWRTLLRVPAYRTPSKASPLRRCGHVSFGRGDGCADVFRPMQTVGPTKYKTTQFKYKVWQARRLRLGFTRLV